LHELLLPQLDQPAEPLVVGEPLRLADVLEGDVVEHLVAGGEGLIAGDMEYIVRVRHRLVRICGFSAPRRTGSR